MQITMLMERNRITNNKELAAHYRYGRCAYENGNVPNRFCDLQHNRTYSFNMIILHVVTMCIFSFMFVLMLLLLLLLQPSHPLHFRFLVRPNCIIFFSNFHIFSILFHFLQGTANFFFLCLDTITLFRSSY